MIGCDPHRRARQSGMVLITALLLLIVVTILADGMFRSFGLDEKIAGNMREKHRALNAAETAEQYAEWWLANGGNGTQRRLHYTAMPRADQGGSNVHERMTNPRPCLLRWTVGRVAMTAGAPTAMNITTAGGQAATTSRPVLHYLSRTHAQRNRLHVSDRRRGICRKPGYRGGRRKYLPSSKQTSDARVAQP